MLLSDNDLEVCMEERAKIPTTVDAKLVYEISDLCNFKQMLLYLILSSILLLHQILIS